MQQATFRDPPALDAEIAALEREIARALVNAPTLPIDLPAFDLTLRGVEARRTSIELVLGKSSPIAGLHLTEAAPGAGTAVAVRIVERHPDARRFRPALLAMQRRLTAAVTADKWQRARGPAERLARLPVGVPLAFYRQLVPGADGQGLVRVGFTCNQDCGMCWQSRQWQRFDADQVIRWIEDLYAAGARRLNISGGEPTLDAALPQYLRRAREVGFRSVTIETNAIRIAQPGVAETLRTAGLSDAFVSLHSWDPAVSDAITRAPGTFVRTVAGIKALLDASVPVRLNCVMTAEGLDRLAGLPDFIHAEFGAHPYLQGVMLSQPCDPYDAALLPRVIPDPDRVREVLAHLIDRAFALGVRISGLDGPCGPPLCAFAADPRITALAPITEALDGRTYLPACAACRVRPACFGVRVADVALYGERCARPL